MVPIRQILCISWEPELAKQREEIFGESGCHVTSVVGLEAAEKAVMDDFDLLVLGHSVPREHKRRLMRMFRAHSEAPILSLLAPGQPPLPEATLGVPGTDPDRIRYVARHFLC